MRSRAFLTVLAVTLWTLLGSSLAFASSPSVPVELTPGEKVVSGSTSTSNDSAVTELLTVIKSVRIGAGKTTVLVNDGGKMHPIEIEYDEVLGGRGIGSAVSGAGEKGEAPSGLSLGQIGAFLLGLTVLSRVIGILRQITGARR